MEILNLKQFSVVDGNETEIIPGVEGFDDNLYIHKTTFELINTSVAFANSLRRSFSTLCPTITLDKENITIETNTTPLHNEFLIHRLELLPIYSDGVVSKDVFRLKTSYNIEEGKRTWNFVDISKVPKFLIDTTKSDTVLTKNSNMNNMADITTDSFIIKNGTTSLSNSEFFKKDIHTNDPILINCLKINPKGDGYRDALKLSGIPVPSIGITNTRNDPTGTVQYKFKLDTDDVIENVWDKKLTYLKQEREINGLNLYTDKEIETLRKTYDLLDKDRVYKKDDTGKAFHFEFGVESIGFLSSNRIIYDSVKHLELLIDDIINSISFKKTSIGTFSLTKNYSKKIEISKFKNSNINSGCSIIIKNENHTLGNLIQDKLREKFLVRGGKGDVSRYLKLANYRMDHPTIEEIELMLSVKENMTTTIMDGFIKDYIKDIYGADSEVKIDKNNREIYFSIYLFIQTLQFIKNDISEFLVKFKTLTQIEDTPYEVL